MIGIFLITHGTLGEAHKSNVGSLGIDVGSC